jgi:hypothetical protein
MSREIKFRAITKGKPSKLVFGCLRRHIDKETGEVFSYISSDKGVLQPVIDSTVSQFTGLKDRNGEDIYEGDIVDFGTDKNSVVKYGEFRFYTQGHGDSGEDFTVGFKIGSSYGSGNIPKVVGNIYKEYNL